MSFFTLYLLSSRMSAIAQQVQTFVNLPSKLIMVQYFRQLRCRGNCREVATPVLPKSVPVGFLLTAEPGSTIEFYHVLVSLS